MNICLITRSHFLNSSRIHGRIAKSLLAFGYGVCVICRSDSERTIQKKTIDGINYYEVPFYGSRKIDIRGTIQITKITWKLGANIIISFEIRTLMIGLLIRILQPLKVVYDCHEYWPEKVSELVSSKQPKLITNIVRMIENRLASYSDLIWTVNDHLAKRFTGLGVPITVLPNYPRLTLFTKDVQPPEYLVNKLSGQYILIYIGGLTEARGITACIKTIAELKKRSNNIHMLFLGSFGYNFQGKMQKIVNQLQLENSITVIERVDHNLIPSYLRLADIGVFLVQPVKERFNWGEPIKYFEYTAAGLPVVMSDLPAKRNLIHMNQNGILVDAEDINKAAEDIWRLLSNPELRNKMSKNGMQAFRSRLNWEQASQAMLVSIQQLIK